MISIILSNHPKAPGPKIHGFFERLLPSIPYEILYVGNPRKPAYTKRLYCGAEAARWMGNYHEGYLHTADDGTICMPTYCPHIGQYYFLSSEESEGKEEENKDTARTRPEHFLHWIKIHAHKLLANHETDETLRPEEILFYPNESEVESFCSRSGRSLYLDIENRMADHSLHCVGLAYSNGPVMVIPIYRFNNELAYFNISRIWKSLARALRRNQLVIHNCMHDISILAFKYSLPFSRDIYDTMVAQHRISPENEKSLDHCVQQWTALPYHKGEFVEPTSGANEKQLWTYNARDVHALRLIHKRQLQHSAAVPGLRSSIDQANQSLYAYRLMELKGMRVNEITLMEQKRKHEKIVEQWGRILNILVGYPINAASPKQVANYLYNEMRYESTEKTETDEEATGAKVLYKLLAKTLNPAIELIIKLKEMKKTVSMLHFESI